MEKCDVFTGHKKQIALTNDSKCTINHYHMLLLSESMAILINSKVNKTCKTVLIDHVSLKGDDKVFPTKDGRPGVEKNSSTVE